MAEGMSGGVRQRRTSHTSESEATIASKATVASRVWNELPMPPPKRKSKVNGHVQQAPIQEQEPIQEQVQEQATPKYSKVQTDDDEDDSNKPHYSKVQKDDELVHPPGYNKKKRDAVKIILVVVALSMLSGNARVSTCLSVLAIICLKEGTLLSVKNLKWLALCIMSFGLGCLSWYLERESADAKEVRSYSLDSILWTSAKIIQLCWGMTLSVFLVSAYVHGHNSLLEFDYLWEQAQSNKPVVAAPRDNDPPPKRYMLY